MRILLIMGAAGGVGRHVTDLASYLLIEGHSVTLIYNSAACDPYIKARVNILDSSGCELVDIKFDRKIGFNDLLVTVKIANFIRHSKPFDIIHGHSSKGGIYARAQHLLSRANIIYSPHAFYTMSIGNNKILNTLIRCIEHALAYITDKIVVTSFAEMDHLNYLGVSQRKAILIPNGSFNSSFDAEGDHPKFMPLHVDSDEFVIGFIGRFCYQKDPDLAIDIFNDCLRLNQNLNLYMVGSGEYEAGLRAKTKSLDIESNVFFIKDAVAEEILPLFDILLVTSRYEGSPYLFQDAVKMGVPIVSTPVGGTEFFVLDGVNGYIFNDSKEAINYILELAASKDALKRFSAEAMLVAKNFSWSRMGQETLNMYQSFRLKK